jgi:hypothetical protein
MPKKTIWWNATRRKLMRRAKKVWPDTSESALVARGLAELLRSEGVDLSDIHGGEPLSEDERIRRQFADDTA